LIVIRTHDELKKKRQAPLQDFLFAHVCHLEKYI